MTYLGGLIGATSPNLNGAATSPGYGFTLGRRMTPFFGVGAYFTRSGHDVLVGSVSSSATFSLYGVEGNYYFTGDMDGLGIGFKLGLANYSVSMSTPIGGMSGSSSSVSTGPQMFFDHRIGENLSVGFQVNVMYQTPQTNVASYNVINLFGAVKYWF